MRKMWWRLISFFFLLILSTIIFLINFYMIAKCFLSDSWISDPVWWGMPDQFPANFFFCLSFSLMPKYISLYIYYLFHSTLIQKWRHRASCLFEIFTKFLWKVFQSEACIISESGAFLIAFKFLSLDFQ